MIGSLSTTKDRTTRLRARSADVLARGFPHKKLFAHMDHRGMAVKARMLSAGERRFLAHQRIAHLATADRRALPHVVPGCFAIADGTLYITIDEKPKRRSGTALKRLRNIA